MKLSVVTVVDIMGITTMLDWARLDKTMGRSWMEYLKAAALPGNNSISVPGINEVFHVTEPQFL